MVSYTELSQKRASRRSVSTKWELRGDLLEQDLPFLISTSDRPIGRQPIFGAVGSRLVIFDIAPRRSVQSRHVLFEEISNLCSHRPSFVIRGSSRSTARQRLRAQMVEGSRRLPDLSALLQGLERRRHR